LAFACVFFWFQPTLLLTYLPGVPDVASRSFRRRGEAWLVVGLAVMSTQEIEAGSFSLRVMNLWTGAGEELDCQSYILSEDS
jgi:hypothetical protein